MERELARPHVDRPADEDRGTAMDQEADADQ
jgi:hypothetical protein